MTRTEEANLLDFITYSQLTANVYEGNKDKNNPLSLNQGNWQQLELYDSYNTYYGYKYDYDAIHKNDRDENGQLIYTNDKKIGLDAAIYKNKDGKVVVTFRGTEFRGSDNDVHESAKILNEQNNLPQFEVLTEFYGIMKETFKRNNITDFEITGHSLGGALAITLYHMLINDEDNKTLNCTKVTTINPINVEYYIKAKYDSIVSAGITNYIVMNDLFGMYNINENNLIGNVKFIFPIEMDHTGILSIILDPLLSFSYPHNDIIEMNDVAQFSEETLDLTENITISNWSSSKGISIWFYDAQNRVTDKKDHDISILLKFLLGQIINKDKYENLDDSAMSQIIESYMNKNVEDRNLVDEFGENNINFEEGDSNLVTNVERIVYYIIAMATKENLKDAIDTINEEIELIPKKLHYRTDTGDFVIGSDDYIKDGKILNIGIDYLEGSNNDDIIWGRGNNDKIVSNAGDNVLIGDYSNHTVAELEFLRDNPLLVVESDFEHEDDGNDIIYGGIDNDLIIGGGGNDVIYGNGGSNVIYCGTGNDRAYGGGVIGVITDENTIYGGSGNDILTAGYGSNSLYGGENNDILSNYKGTAYMEGLSGYDIYNITRISDNVIRDDFAGKGCVKLNELKLDGASSLFYLGLNTWYRPDIDVRYVLSDNTLLINNNTVILDFKNGDLEIFLEYPTAKPEDADGIQSDPLIFDLNGDGIKTSLSPHQGIYYDYNNDGFAEKLSWSAYGDGVLVADTNNDGKIQGSGDILTSLTLASYDTNFDGKINYQDEYFNNLKIMDEEYNLYSLEEAGISSINLDYQNVNFTEENGNECKKIATYTKTNGQELQYGEYLVQTNPQNAIELNKLEETEAVSALPDIDNSGTVYSLHQAMLRDNELQTLVTSFTTETNDNVRMNLLEQIILKWTGAEDVEINSRGSHINAQHLAAIEAFDGIDFYSKYEADHGDENTIPANPNIEAANLLATKYEQIKNNIYAQLMQQSHLSSFYNAIDKTGMKYDLSPVITMLQAQINQNETIGKDLVYQVVKMLKGLGIDNFSNFFDPKDDSCFYTTFTKDDRELKWLIDSIGKVRFEDELGFGEGSAADDAFRLNLSGSFHALSGDDVIYGSYEDDAFSGCSGDDIVDAGAGNDTIFTQSGRDLIYAGDGNDTIIAGEDDDIIFGGNGDDLIYPDNETSFSPTRTNDDIIRGEKGNDTVISLRGNDTYLFFPDDGQDTIIEKQGVDTCYFGGGITWDDLTFSQQGNDMVISILNSTDKITVKDWFVSDEDGVYRYDNNKIEIFEFDDGSIHYKDEITVGDNSEPVKYIMNEMGNEIELASNYKTEVILKSGYNNIIAGQNSDDVYILNNQGTDAYISDYSGDNIVKFNPSISLAHTFFAADENGIEVWFDNFDSHLLIRGDNFSFEFADNSTVYELHDLLIKDVSYSDYTMGEKLQELKLLGYDSASITGNNLDNLIINGNGSYVIEANGGNDIIESIFGSYDTYKYNIGDGVDTITDIGGNDFFVFGEGITQDNVRFIKDLSNNNLEIFFDFDSEANSKIIINNFFEDPKFKIESFVFADNSVISNIEEHLFAISPNKDLNEPFVLAEGVKNIRLKGENHYTVIGNDLNNSIDGNIGNNSYQGGLGNDSYHDFAKSNERYYFNIGDGNDSIDDIGGIDAIIFGEDVSRNSFNVIKNDNDMLINFSNIQDNSIRIIDYFNNDERKIELFKFADSFVIDNITPYIKTVLSDSQNIVLTGTQQNAVLIGTENFAAIGNDLDNNIRGNDGNNTIVGHGGNDIIQDTAGDDTYAYYIGDGFDTITDNAGNDRICFGEGISSQNIIFEKHTNDLLIKFNQIEGSIRVVGYFDENLDNKIEKFEFSDGTFITDISDLIVEVQQPDEQPDSSGQNTQENESSPDSLQSGSIVLDEDASSVTLSGSENSVVLGNNLDNTVTGNSGDNTYALCGGNDLVIDTQGGNDTYIYNINDDNLYIADVNGSDVIKFGPEINPDRLRFERQEDNLYIYINDSNGHIRITNYFSNDSFKIEKFVFDDGTEVTDISNILSGVAPKENYTFSENSIIRIARMAGTDNISVTGNSQNNIIEGNSGNNTFEGKGGNDTLIDVLGGNDTYIFNIGDGNDTIEDIGGTDTLKFGNSISPEDVVFVRFDSDLHVTFKDIPQNGIVIKDFFSDTTKKIERFEFSDGTVITDISNLISTIISEDNIVLPNGIKDAVLEGVLNTTVTGNGLDNNIKGNSGNNTYSAGEGNDHIQDEDGGNDIYIYNLGDGNDLIKDSNGNDVIKFGQGISKNNLVFIMHNKDLLINFKNNLGEKIDGSIRIEGYFAEDSRAIEHIEFADGSVISDLSSFVSILAADFDVHNSASYPRIQLWGENDISVFGEYSDELVIGNSGNNRYDLLGGNDTIIDTQGGNDTYIFNSDYENKVIKDIGGNDSIEFGLDILSDDTFFLKGADDLHIYFANNSNSSIIVQDYFADNNSKIENFEFKNNNSVISDISDIISGIASSDNIVLQNSHTQARLLGDSNASVTGSYNDDKIYGNSGNNTYCAGQGNDRIEDKFGGDDTYIYNLGDGYDYIVDVGGFDSINFGEGISLDNLRFVHKYNNLLVYVDSGNNSGLVEVDNHYRYDSRKIEQIKFSNNSVLSDFSSLLSGITINDDYSIDENADISEVYLQGTNDISVSGNSANCYFEGNSGNNTYEGKGGVDVFYDDQGNDTYIYNIGDGTDYITDNSGIDSISFGTGISLNNVIFRHQSDDLSNLQINFEGFDGGIIVFDFFANENNKIEKFEFSDGTVITDISPYLPSLPDVESIPSAVQDENYSVDINLLIQEMNSYGVDNDVILNDFQNQNNEDILLAMAS